MLIYFSEFIDKKSLLLMYFLQESDRKNISSYTILARNFLPVWSLQEMYFLPESFKICIFCQDVALFLQEFYLFSTIVMAKLFGKIHFQVSHENCFSVVFFNLRYLAAFPTLHVTNSISSEASIFSR